MNAILLSLSDRQSMEAQRRAAIACARQEQERNRRLTLDELFGGIVGHASLDDWYRAQPIAKGRIKPALHLSRDERQLYGLPVSARLVDLKGLGQEVDDWRIVVMPVMGGRVVGVKAPHGGGGVGVLWRLARKANDYALRLHTKHGFPIVQAFA